MAGTFVVVSGLAYFVFMAAWLNVLLFVGYLWSVQVMLGVTALFIGCPAASCCLVFGIKE